ncbi:MAG: hypothetical protein AABX03_02140 [Nanoarchaeota archaeon]
MKELIDYAVALMSSENIFDGESNPQINGNLNPQINSELNVMQNREINPTQVRELAPSQNTNWKSAWWRKFQETILWEYLDDSQKKRCWNFLKQLEP